ncbi:MAG: hypothetical protein WAV28_04615 [Sedimentisphaerales bacterium]|jgi:hypothetical protein
MKDLAKSRRAASVVVYLLSKTFYLHLLSLPVHENREGLMVSLSYLPFIIADRFDAGMIYKRYLPMDNPDIFLDGRMTDLV